MCVCVCLIIYQATHIRVMRAFIRCQRAAPPMGSSSSRPAPAPAPSLKPFPGEHSQCLRCLPCHCPYTATIYIHTYTHTLYAHTHTRSLVKGPRLDGAYTQCGSHGIPPYTCPSSRKIKAGKALYGCVCVSGVTLGCLLMENSSRNLFKLSKS